MTGTIGMSPTLTYTNPDNEWSVRSCGKKQNEYLIQHQATLDTNYSETYINKRTTVTSTYDERWTNITATSTGDNLLYYTWDKGTATAIYGDHNPIYVPTVAERLREIIRQRQAPNILSKRRSLSAPRDIREQRARETLRQVIGDDEFRSFLRNGFITVRAKSGLVYQVFPGHGITQVYNQGKMVERLCVCLKGSFPATDELIMRYLMILNDEDDFRSHANTHGVYNSEQSQSPATQLRSLPEIFAGLKAA